MKNEQCKRGRRFTHKNGKQYIVVAEDGCFYKDGNPVFGMFGARTLKDGKPFGPMRDMKLANVATWETNTAAQTATAKDSTI